MLGNALDGGVGVTLAPYRNHFEAQCGIEVVLPNGRMMRTGMGALPGAKTWQQFKPGFGPRIDGLFKQSNYGVVTKMGFWLMPAAGELRHRRRHGPEVPRSHSARRHHRPARAEQDRAGLVDAVEPHHRHARRRRARRPRPPKRWIPRILAILNDPDGVDMDKLDAAAQSAGLPFWACDFNLYGPEKLIKAQWDCVCDALGAIPGAQFKLNEIRSLPLPPKSWPRCATSAPSAFRRCGPSTSAR